MNHEQFLNLLASGKEVYFINTFDEIVFKSIPNEGYEAKTKGGKPYKAELGSASLTEAFLESKEITKEEYESF